MAINIPDQTGKETVSIVGDRIIFASIDYDQGTENPLKDCDGMGEIYSFSRRHYNLLSPMSDEAVAYAADPDCVMLSYFEHGNCLWMVAGGPTPAGVEFQWDGTRYAGIWVPDETVRGSYTGQDGLCRRDWMEQQAASACDVYSQWCNGEVYYYSVQMFALRRWEDGTEMDESSDYRRDDPIEDDSCGGIYGFYYTINEVKEIVERFYKEEQA